MATPFLRGRLGEERAELLALLLERGILHASDTQQVRSRDGTTARWMLETWPVTLEARGLELAGKLLLGLLEGFEGRQLATYGTTGVPLLSSMILQSGGRYTGLVVRKERKAHGSSKLVEGAPRLDEPVVLVDDSVSSGTSLWEGTKRLEEHGLLVEGGVALVRFGYKGGESFMSARGYRVEHVYDIWEDFMTRMPGEAKPERNPTRPCFDFALDDGERCPEGLTPSALARFVMERFVTTGRVPTPPASLAAHIDTAPVDNAHIDTAGGAWVSVRSRKNIHVRHAREGFWRFPWDAPSPSAASDVVLAAARTAMRLPLGDAGKRLLDESGLAVTWFSALERCTPGALDNDRYGIVVRSRERTALMGGALPRMPGIASSWMQLEHARIKNARLMRHEPFEVFRHDVTKDAEPDIDWQPTGVPRTAEPAPVDDERCCAPIARRALGHMRRAMGLYPFAAGDDDDAAPPVALPQRDLDSVYLTVYLDGRLAGCMGSRILAGGVDDTLRQLAPYVARDSRFPRGAGMPSRVAASVSFLTRRLALGRFTPEEVAQRVRRGEQALMAHQGEKAGLLLPFVAALFDKDGAGFARDVLAKANITEPPYSWVRFDASTWLAQDDGAVVKLEGALPKRPERRRPSSSHEALARRMAGYLVRQQRDDGSFWPHYHPLRDQRFDGIDPPRMAHGAFVLARAGRLLGDEGYAAAGARALDFLLLHLERDDDGSAWLNVGGRPSTVAEVSFALLASLELGREDAAGLAPALASRIDRHGRVATQRGSAREPDGYQDYFPAQVLLALGEAAAKGAFTPDDDVIARALRLLRMRFLARRSLGMISWLPQALEAWGRARGRDDERDRALAYDVADFILDYQSERTGAFLNEHQPDTPGFTTALYVEGIAASARVAERNGDKKRAQRYRSSCARAVAFTERLVVDGARDRALLPDPERADGAVLPSLSATTVRADFPAHALAALLQLIAHAPRPRSSPEANGSSVRRRARSRRSAVTNTRA